MDEKPPRSLQPGKRPRPPTRREVPAIPPSPGACFHAGSLQPGKRPRPPTRREVPAIPPSPGACFHAGSLQPGKRPRPPTRREVPAIPPSPGGVLPCKVSAVERRLPPGRRRERMRARRPGSSRSELPTRPQGRASAASRRLRQFSLARKLRRKYATVLQLDSFYGACLLAACRTSDGASWPNADRLPGRPGLGRKPEGNGSCGAREPRLKWPPVATRALAGRRVPWERGHSGATRADRQGSHSAGSVSP